MSAGHAYLSVVDWPAGFSRLDAVTALVSAAGIDPFHAEQRCIKPPPMLVSRMPEAAARAADDALHRMGVTSFVLTDSEIDAAKPPIRAKRLEAAAGAPEPMYVVEPWHSRERMRIGLVCSRIFLIVRAQLSATRAGTPDSERRTRVDPIGGIYVESVTVPTTQSSSSHVMDIHMRDGSRVRIDGSKFNFDVLGAERGLSDSVNADRLALRIAQQSPRAVVDTAFRQFAAHGTTAGLISGRGTRVGRDGRVFKNDQPVFEFYSIWAAALYRRMLGAA